MRSGFTGDEPKLLAFKFTFNIPGPIFFTVLNRRSFLYHHKSSAKLNKTMPLARNFRVRSIYLSSKFKLTNMMKTEF